MTPLHPSSGRVMVKESPVDTTEEERPSGLVVKRQPDHETLKRGIVIELGHLPHVISDDRLKEGCVVFYTTGYEVGEYVFVDYQHIVAWEDELPDYR